jgi:hypothetical protein
MKGRVYDPAEKRFLTPDPMVGDPADGQQYNPYSYVRNSPLNNMTGGDCAPGVSCDTVLAVQARDAALLLNYKLQELAAHIRQRDAEVNQSSKPWGWNGTSKKVDHDAILGKPDQNHVVHTGRPDGEIVFEGHGTWREIDGYIVVPEGTTITFYSPHGTSIWDYQGPLIAKDVEIGTINVDGKLVLFQPQTFYPGDVIPNYTLRPNGPMIHGDTEFFVSQNTRLDVLLQPNMGNVHWAACRQVIPDWYTK